MPGLSIHDHAVDLHLAATAAAKLRSRAGAQLVTLSENENRRELCNTQLHRSRGTDTKAALPIWATSNAHLRHWNARCGHDLHVKHISEALLTMQHIPKVCLVQKIPTNNAGQDDIDMVAPQSLEMSTISLAFQLH